jgi:hypothetical protein
MICEQEYEARMTAYDIVHDLALSIPGRVKNKALKILEEYQLMLEQTATDKGEDSTLHFVEETQRLLS